MTRIWLRCVDCRESFPAEGAGLPGLAFDPERGMLAYRCLACELACSRRRRNAPAAARRTGRARREARAVGPGRAPGLRGDAW